MFIDYTALGDLFIKANVYALLVKDLSQPDPIPHGKNYRVAYWIGVQKKYRTTMSDVELCQESFAHGFTASIQSQMDLFRQLHLLPPEYTNCILLGQSVRMQRVNKTKTVRWILVPEIPFGSYWPVIQCHVRQGKQAENVQTFSVNPEQSRTEIAYRGCLHIHTFSIFQYKVPIFEHEMCS